MKTRYQYALLFGVPGFLVACVAAFWAFGLAAGVAWLYLFGDDAWPAGAEPVLLGLFTGVFLLVWGFAICWGYRIGRSREPAGGLDRRHLVYAAGITVFVLLLGTLHQYRSGNLGPPAASTVCMDYCRSLGYDASGLTPRDSGERICSCYEDGEVGARIALESLENPKASP